MGVIIGFITILLALSVNGFKRLDLSTSKDDSIGDDQFFDDGETVTLTVYSTYDHFATVTNKHYNSIPLTITEFSKATVTLPTREIVRTPVNDIVRVSTVQVTHTGTETVTDVFSIHKCSTEVSTELFTVTHLNQNVLQTTLTRTLVSTLTFQPTIVQTVISTEREVVTETEYFTETIWVDTATRKFPKFNKFY